MIKKFEEYIKENYLDNSSDPEILKYDFKKMKKNGYIEVIVKKEIDGVNKDEIVMTNSSEFGELPDDAIVTCITKKGDEIMIVKQNLQVKK